MRSVKLRFAVIFTTFKDGDAELCCGSGRGKKMCDIRHQVRYALAGTNY